MFSYFRGMLALTYTEENYLKAIYGIQTGKAMPEVSVNEIAERMQTKPATVTDMLRKLSDKELIHYEKYKKIQLSDTGETEALSILRKHRLWESFLYKKLNFSWDEVHEVAEQLEHIRSQKLVDRLDEFLGFPQYDPHGDPIPQANGHLPDSGALPLYEAVEGKAYKIVAVKDTSTAFLQQLKRFDLQIGTQIKISERMPYDNSVVITVGKGQTIQLSEKITQNLLVV